jgi:hypothetical protein
MPAHHIVKQVGHFLSHALLLLALSAPCRA